MNKKVALYCRVSTGHQISGLESQVRALRDYCVRNGFNDYVIYEDENQSGTKQSRPALDRMMKDARDGGISQVIVYSFSRYARSVTHLLRALEEFKTLGVGFTSLSEAINTDTPIGRALFVILGSVAQLERDILAERVRNGLANARAKGVRIGRLKTRDSDLIRKLRASGLTFRECARIAGCSTGAVGAEMRALKAERKAEQEAKIKFEESLPQLDFNSTQNFIERGFSPSSGNEFENVHQGVDLNLELET